MLANPSFERAETRLGTSLPKDWDAWTYAGTIHSWAGDQGRGGSAAGCVEVTPDGAAEFPQFCQRFRVRPGERYRASVWVRTEGVASSWGPQLNFEFFDRAGKRLPYIEGGQAGGSTRPWVQLTNEAYVPANAAEMLFSLFLHGEGKAYFDDAELAKVADPDPFTGAQVEVRVRPGQTVNPDFLGFGAHGDWLLGLDINTRHGVEEADFEQLRERIASMRPGIMRLFFDYAWWEPVKGRFSTNSQALQGMIGWIEFLNTIHCDVIIHPWGDHFAYSDWMLPADDPRWWTNRDSRLPISAQRDSMVRSLADFINYLRTEKRLANVKYVSLMNEPENDFRRPTPVAEYIRLNRLLLQLLKARKLDQDVILLGPDDCTAQHNGCSLWWRQTLPGAVGVFRGLSSHTYKHRDTRMLKTWVQDRLDHVEELDPDGPVRPLLVTEFGYVGLDSGTFDNPEVEHYEYGLFAGDFAIEILNSKASAALIWCLFDQYYSSEHCQHYGLWKFKDQGWQPRPAFYSWSLINRYTQAHSRVVRTDVVPAAESLRAAAVMSPEGKLTLMMVNRYDRAMHVALRHELNRPANLRLHRYTKPAVRAATGRLFDPVGRLRVAHDKPISLELPAQSFALLTELTPEE